VLWLLWTGAVAWAYLDAGRPLNRVPFSVSLVPPLWQMSLSAAWTHTVHLLKLGVFVAMTWSTGRALLQRVAGTETLNSLERFSFSFGLGLGLLGYAVFGLAALGFLRQGAVMGLTVFLLAGGILGNRDLWPFPLKGARRGTGFRRRFMALGLTRPGTALLAAAVILVLLFHGFHALAPEIFYDSLVHHLALPSLYAMEGGFVPTPTNAYSGIPMHTEMLYTWALLVDDEILAKLIHWSLGLGLAAAMLGLAQRRKTPGAGWLACLVFFSSPLVGLNLWKTAIDGSSSFFVFLAVQALMLSLPDSDRFAARLRVLAAVFTGLAMATKYTNWPMALVLWLCLLGTRTSWRASLSFGLIAAACVAPWVAKNIFFTGNPIFPFFHDLWQPDAVYPVNWRGFQGHAGLRRWGDILSAGPGAILTVLAHPWTLTMQGFSIADFLGPAFLIGLPALILFRPQTVEGRLWRWVFLGMWMAWWPVTSLVRFFMPGLALLSVWIGLAVSEARSQTLRRTLTGVFVAAALANVASLTGVAHRMGAWPYLVGRQSKASYLAHVHQFYSAPYYASAAWINANAPAQARVLVVGGARAYYIQRPFQASTLWDVDLFSETLRQSASAEDMNERLRKRGFDFLLVNMEELEIEKGLDRREPFTAGQLRILEDFFRRFTQKRFEDHHHDAHGAQWTLVYERVPRRSGPADEEIPLVAWHRSRQKRAVPLN
jgi:hypothetical protein